MKRPNATRTGFATVVALVLLSLVGITIAGLMTRISYESRRTLDESDQAEIRQLLIAGANAHAPTDVQIPPQLSQDGFALNIKTTANVMVIEARRAGHRETFEKAIR